MGQGRPTGASYAAAHATIDLDLSSLTAAPRVAQAAGEATAKALQQSLKIVQNEQKIAIANAQQATAAAKAQQAQITATTRAESAERIAQARSEAAATQQQARAAATTVIEEERRKTAQLKQEFRERNRAASQVSAGSFAQGAASFAGAALGGPIGGLIGAATMGNPAIAAGVAVNQGVRAAVDASQVATAYNRQNVAALQLAGSQAKLNDMLAAYDQATGGAIDKATSLANVTKLQAVGFADNVPEITKFATAIRGISIAMATSQDTVTQNLVLELFSQRGQRLDQLGLNYEKVKQRVKELEAADSNLTSRQAYQNAVLEQAEQRYGKLAKSAEGAATGLEKVTKASANAQLAIGQALSGPVNLGGNIVAAWIESQTSLLQGETRAAQDLYAALQRLTGVQVATGMQQRFVAGSAGRDIGRHPEARNNRPAAIDPNADAIQQVHLNWAQGITDLDAKTHAAILDEETSFGESRAKTVADYNKSVARDEASYARSRLRQNLDQLDALASVAKDATRREQRETTDLARTQAQTEADSADKVAGIRKDANKRLADLEESYQADQAKAARHYHNSIIEAAGRLDAKAVAEAQRNYQEQRQDAKDAHDKQIKDNNDQLKERLDDEAKSLAKSLKQQQDAYDRQISEGRANDALKLQDMKDAFAKSQARAAEDHGIEVAQRAQDQADELTAMDAQHNLRLTQIAVHAQADRDALDEQAKIDLLALGVRNAAWQKVEDAKEAHREKLWNDFMARINGTLLQGRPDTPQMVPGFASGGFVPHDMTARLHAREFIFSTGMQAGSQAIPASVRNAVAANGGGSRTISVGDIHIYGAATDSPEDFARRFKAEMRRHLEKMRE